MSGRTRRILEGLETKIDEVKPVVVVRFQSCDLLTRRHYDSKDDPVSGLTGHHKVVVEDDDQNRKKRYQRGLECENKSSENMK